MFEDLCREIQQLYRGLFFPNIVIMFLDTHLTDTLHGKSYNCNKYNHIANCIYRFTQIVLP